MDVVLMERSVDLLMVNTNAKQLRLALVSGRKNAIIFTKTAFVAMV